MESESETWFQNESANESGLDFEEGNSNMDESDMETEEPRTEQAVRPVVYKKEVKWREQVSWSYRKGSKSKQMRKQRSARELENEALKTYNIQALWQQHLELGMISAGNIQDELEQPTESLPNNSVSSVLKCEDR